MILSLEGNTAQPFGLVNILYATALSASFQKEIINSVPCLYLDNGAHGAGSFAVGMEMVQPLLQLLGVTAEHCDAIHCASCNTHTHTHTSVGCTLQGSFRLGYRELGLGKTVSKTFRKAHI